MTCRFIIFHTLQPVNAPESNHAAEIRGVLIGMYLVLVDNREQTLDCAKFAVSKSMATKLSIYHFSSGCWPSWACFTSSVCSIMSGYLNVLQD